MFVDSISVGIIHTFVRPRQIVMWRMSDDKYSRTYSYVDVHWAQKYEPNLDSEPIKFPHRFCMGQNGSMGFAWVSG